MVSGVSIVLCILSSFIPARLAAKVDPVTAIRFV
jgi:ABC-type lipoprotein release transport system permease subunit